VLFITAWKAVPLGTFSPPANTRRLQTKPNKLFVKESLGFLFADD